ncbi:MAG: TIGR03936 family radical SAM-associated protein [Clostridia bacterium]
MVKLRAIFSKSKESIYLSQIDMMGIFEKSFKRANIPFEYTKLPNSRPNIVFATQIEIGIESMGDIFEIVLIEKLPITYVIRELNKYLPASITILSAEYINLQEESIVSRVYASIYTIEICYTNEMIINKSIKDIEDLKKYYNAKMYEYLSQEFLLVIKKSEERMERIDIKPYIYDYSFLFDGKLQLTVQTTSEFKLNPDYLMIGFNEYISNEVQYIIRREKILFK